MSGWKLKEGVYKNMNRKNHLILLAAASVAILAIIIGCGTEDPWEPAPSTSVQVFLVQAPDTATVIPHNSQVHFSWTAQGGSNEFTYSWYLSPTEADYNTASNADNATYSGLQGDTAAVAYTFYVRAQDSEGRTGMINSSFTVSAMTEAEDDVTPPTITFPDIDGETGEHIYEGWYFATGQAIEFAWEGDDGYGNASNIEYQYEFISDTSEWMMANTASFTGADVQATNPATFSVRARDMGYDVFSWWLDGTEYDTLVHNADSVVFIENIRNMSDWISTTFIIRDANILYIDDLLFVDGFGDPDNDKERDQKQFYRDALEGYAMAEWDNDLQGIPDSVHLSNFDVVVWAADADHGTPDQNYRLWFDVGAVGGGILKGFMDGGGQLILTGSQVLDYLWNSNPPAAVDFEADYLGVHADDPNHVNVDTVTWWIGDVAHDTSVVSPDSANVDSTYESWGSDYWFTNAHAADPDYPALLTIDISKNDGQANYTNYLITDDIYTVWWKFGEPFYTEPDGGYDSVFVDTAFGLADGTTTLFTSGLDIDGDIPAHYEQTIGWLYAPGGNAISATLAFDTYEMSMEGIRQTFQNILTEFGQ